MIEKKVVYFEKPGKENTDKCVNIVKEAVRAEGFGHVVLATTTGETAEKMAEALAGAGVNIVAVTHSAGFKGPNTFEMPEGTRQKLISSGVKIFTGPMLTHSLEAAFSSKFSGIYPAMIIAQSLRRMGEGTKVVCECVMMAADAGLIPEGEEVIGVAGTAYGADTVLVVRSAASKRFMELKILEILAKPRG